VAALAPAYLPRRPTETVLYDLVRENVESFVAYAGEHYDRGLPRYVEREMRAYLKCGVFSEGFTRARCDACGHDLLVAFSCKTRTVCPSCTGRRMANTAAAIVDRVLPDVPVRQYVLTLPYELRKLAAFKADVLTAIGRIAIETIFASYRARAKRQGIEDGHCGAVTFVQRFGSLNLNVHFHVAVLDGVFTREGEAPARVVFHSASTPTREDLDAIVQHVSRRVEAWLRRRRYLDEQPLEERSNEPPVQTALDACAAIALGRGRVATLPNDPASDPDHETPPDKPAVAVERNGFNLHAGVRIQAGDDLGRERLMRYGARPPLSLERLRRLPGGRVAYRLKYVARGRGKFRIMTTLEFMARLCALIAPPRYPLVRYAGVLGPRSAWRKDVVPKPRPRRPERCAPLVDASADAAIPREKPLGQPSPAPLERSRQAPEPAHPAEGGAATIGLDASQGVRRPGDIIALAPNVLSVQHWDRLLGGVLYAASPRVEWAALLRRSFDVDVTVCAKCGGRVRVLAVITEPDSARRILAHLGMAMEAPPVARARDPTDDANDVEPSGQLAFDLA
jgi:hypothetical protein